jgi:hypothetical protein
VANAAGKVGADHARNEEDEPEKAEAVHIAAARFAGEHPTQVDRLVLFGPIGRRTPPGHEPTPSLPAWRVVSLEDQWTRFVEDVPAGEPPVLSRGHFADWGERYLDSDPGSRQRDPASVKIPSGPVADIFAAWLKVLREGLNPGCASQIEGEAAALMARGMRSSTRPD